MNDQKLIGVDLGGTTAKFAILNQDGEIQQRWSIPTNILDEGSHIVPDIIASINEHIKLYNMKPEDFVGIGMGTPGSVDVKAGTVTNAFNLNWKTTQYVKRDIEAGTGIKFVVDNDANAAAMGERWKGAGDNADDVVFVPLGTGVGGGIIANGQLLHGVAGAAGEVGHASVDPNGYKCNCGSRGCLETVASATGVVRVARDMAEEFAGESQLKQTLDDGDEISSKMVFDLAKEGDKLALMVVDRVCFYLGFSMANLANTLNPKYVIIGGGVSAAGNFLLSRVQATFEKYTFTTVRESTSLRLATLGNAAGVIGAASLLRA